MTTFGQKLDNAAGAATCQALQTGGAALIGYGAVGLAAGGTGVVPIAAGSLALLASNLACTWDPNNPGPPPQKEGRIGGCLQVDRKAQIVFVGSRGKEGTNPFLEWRRLDSAIFQGTNDDGDSLYQLGGLNGNGTLSTLDGVKVDKEGEPGYFTLNSGPDNPCTNDEPIPDIPPVEIPPYEYTDPEDGCELTVNLKGFQQDPTGAINPVFKIEPSANELLRADGGVIGGCNFSPVIYTGGPPGRGQPPQYRSWNPDWDEPGGGLSPWQDFLNDLAGSLISNLLYDALSDLYATPLPGATYKLIAPCDEFEPGVPKQIEVQIPTLPTNQGIATRIEALIPILQGQKDFKQPVCPPAKPEGEFRTIGFISENYSPNGNNYLRKRLRYRSVSGIGQDALIDYWKDFEFDAGPVTTKHRGASWGTVTVWAASAEEGKRVIRHAAGEALIDVDSVGRWEISGSTSARLGMPGRMKVNTSGGYFWITERDGASGRPLVGTI